MTQVLSVSTQQLHGAATNHRRGYNRHRSATANQHHSMDRRQPINAYSSTCSQPQLYLPNATVSTFSKYPGAVRFILNLNCHNFKDNCANNCLIYGLAHRIVSDHYLLDGYSIRWSDTVHTLHCTFRWCD